VATPAPDEHPSPEVDVHSEIAMHSEIDVHEEVDVHEVELLDVDAAEPEALADDIEVADGELQAILHDGAGDRG
jgi:hypothetical protein